MFALCVRDELLDGGCERFAQNCTAAKLSLSLRRLKTELVTSVGLIVLYFTALCNAETLCGSLV